MKKALILGAQGNLGSQLSKVFPDSVLWDRENIDVTNQAELEQKISELSGLELIINCAAYNDLDKAESERDIVFKLNSDAPKYTAQIAKKLGITFVHYSTGYVFSGYDKTIHTEDDQPDPISIYAESKLSGEKVVQEVGGKYYIIRTNVLFGPKAPNVNAKPSVVDTLRKVGSEKKLLQGITDELSNFTYTPDLAQGTLDLVESGKPEGIYHITNEDYGSWYDLAKQIFTTLGWQIHDVKQEQLGDKEIVIEKITSADYPRQAKRPKSAVLLNTKAQKLRSWQEALQEYLLNQDTQQ
jgi:dTDP-4-dehydrorhamnose reductase